MSNKSLTKEECIEIAKNFNNIIEFKKKYFSVYGRIIHKKWYHILDDIFPNRRKPPNYWTFEKCKEEALKYNYKADFKKNGVTPYRKSLRNGWLNEITSHMVLSGDKYKRCVYVYEFFDNHAYVGLTYNMEVRKNKRKLNPKDSVIIYINKTGLIPELKTLTNYIPVKEAVELEKYYYENYKHNGWKMLNRAKTGGIGGGIVWTKEKCLETAKNIKSRTELYSKYTGLVQAAKRNGWWNEVLLHIPLKRKINEN